MDFDGMGTSCYRFLQQRFFDLLIPNKVKIILKMCRELFVALVSMKKRKNSIKLFVMLRNFD